MLLQPGTPLNGTPLEIGRELECLANNVSRALASGDIADLGHPNAENPLVKNPDANALLFSCQAEHCQRVTNIAGLGTIVDSPCNFGAFRQHDGLGGHIEDQYQIPTAGMLEAILGACANQRQNPTGQQG